MQPKDDDFLLRVSNLMNEMLHEVQELESLIMRTPTGPIRDRLTESNIFLQNSINELRMIAKDE